jgi:hypothetical protein
MKSHNDHNKAIEVTRAVVHAWDPYSLLQQGAPRDEFDPEIAELITYVPKITCASDATQAISLVFSRAFEPELFTNDSCSEVGESWYNGLSQAGLVHQA